MINLQEYLYKKIKNILDSWDLSDSYSVSFFIYSNECNEYKDYSNISEFNISKNDETFFKENYSGEDEGLYSEDRWNYAFLEMDEYDILDEETMEILFDWYKQEGIENIGYEDHDCYDEHMRYIGKGPVGYYELLEVVTEVAKQLIEEDYFLNRVGKRIPIIIQDYEFTWYVIEATKKANIHDEAKDFFTALNEGYM
ncbi:hypothetical protein [Candidatus Stoquefichus sp. SB1]|uniref:hypothetical protein n=1 Tax=Candidatus Stoquefichus sp. SB1 TaxID=1658109 RepID=UPI00067F5B86|nr:hypothetical protein [Candidatus Stoquefichus sp. SB1]